MLNREPLEQDALRAALGPTGECPTIEELESFASREPPAVSTWIGHVQACAYCQTELHLLRTFLASEAGQAAQDGSEAARLLRKRSKEIFQQAFPVRAPAAWWKSAFMMRRMAQASLAAAAILLVAGAVVFFRSTTYRPPLEAKNQAGQEVLRSGGFAVLSPAGDLQARPREIRWERVPKAAGYRISLLEVDRSEMWKAETPEDHIELPASIQARIVPAKTIFCEIIAVDSSGNTVGDTGLVRFRLLQNAGGR